MDPDQTILQLQKFFESLQVSNELLEFMCQPQENGETHQQQYKMLLEMIRKLSMQVRECEETIASFQSAVTQVEDLKNAEITRMKTEIQTLVSKNDGLILEISRANEILEECRSESHRKILKMAEECNKLMLENKRLNENNNTDQLNEIKKINEEKQNLLKDNNYLKLENKEISDEFKEGKRKNDEEMAKLKKENQKLLGIQNQLISGIQRNNEEMVIVSKNEEDEQTKISEEYQKLIILHNDLKLKYEHSKEYQQEYEDFILVNKDLKAEISHVKQENYMYEEKIKEMERELEKRHSKPSARKLAN